ncbi:MAG: imidazole glycerol phosphate synthase subunit HisH, partial [Candidatus Binatia bacterium]
MIAVIDYDVGNLRSVAKALERVGAAVAVSDDPTVIATADAVVLPGVGAFARCMANLEAKGLRRSVHAAVDSGRPFLGICVGMQILFDESDEFGVVRGLGIVPGRVRRFRDFPPGLKIPHMGWNELNLQRRAPHLAGVEGDERFYFVHSYYVETEEDEVVAATTDYGCEFVSAVWRDN